MFIRVTKYEDEYTPVDRCKIVLFRIENIVKVTGLTDDTGSRIWFNDNYDNSVIVHESPDEIFTQMTND